MLSPVLALLMGLLVVEPWVLISQITRQECHQGTCQPSPRQRLPQERVVQHFGTVEECLKVRETMQRQVLEAVEPIDQVVHERNPVWYLRLSTTFVCRPDSGTTGEQLR
jgi:hypothetical protein